MRRRKHIHFFGKASITKTLNYSFKNKKELGTIIYDMNTDSEVTIYARKGGVSQ